MKGGIPQGSALGPLLFLIYMNSLPPQITQGLLLQYADDTALICSGPTPAKASTVMNSELLLIQQWIVASKMRLSPLLCGLRCPIVSSLLNILT